MGVDTDIHKAVFDRLIANGIINVAWPNVNYSESKPYYRISILPAPTVPFGISATDIYEGFVQIDVVITDDIGAITATDLVAGILAIFPRNLYVTEGSTEIGFRQKGWSSPAITEGASYFIPITIPYIIIQ